MKEGLFKFLGMPVEALIDEGVVPSEQAHIEQLDDRFYLDAPQAGLSGVAQIDRKVTSIQLYSPGFQGYEFFRGTLPLGLSFSQSRHDVRKRLGQPSTSGGATSFGSFGAGGPWDRFSLDEYSIHVQYAPDESSIQLLTLMPSSVEKRIS